MSDTKRQAKGHRVRVPRYRAILPGGLLLITLLWGTAAAFGVNRWSPVQNLSSSPDRSTSVQLAQDPITELIHAVWVDGEPWNEEILTRRRDPDDGSWTPIENLSQFEWVDSGPALLFDREGRGHLLWTRRYAVPENGSDLMYRQWSDGAWQPEVVLDHNPSITPGPYGLVLAEKSDRVVLFMLWNEDYRYAEFQDGTWSALTPWNRSLNVRLARAIADEQDGLHAGAYGPNSDPNDPYFFDAYYLYHDGSGWTEPLNLSSTQGIAYDLDLAFDALGRLHFIWSDPDNPNSTESEKSAVWERVLDGDTWSPNAEITADNADQTILDADLVAAPTSSGTLHLAWSEGLLVAGAATGVDIYHQTGDGSSWSGEEKVYTSTLMSRHLSLLASQQGDAYLAWEEGEPISATQEIFFAYQVPPIVYPPSLHSDQCPDEQMTLELSICNVGDLTLEWEATEVPADIPWLSEDPISGMVLPDACQLVEVTFDATGLAPADYDGYLVIVSNDLDTPTATLPTSLTVLEPASITDVTYMTDTLQVTFDATVDGVGPFTYAWDFGDSNTSDLEDPVHSYADEGCYTVTFTAINDCAIDVWSDEVCVEIPFFYYYLPMGHKNG